MSTLDDDDNDDIYRGDPPPQPRSPSITPSSSSSSSSSRTGGPLGAIAAVVELAITRWARSNSLSPSSSSFRSSMSRSQIRHRRRRASSGNLHSVQSERDISARIKAREESRLVPREFSLYLPSLPEDPPLVATASDVGGHTRGVAKSSSLQPILCQLDTALKKSAKARRNQDRTRVPKFTADHTHAPHPLLPHNDYMLPDDIRAPSRPASFTDLRALHRVGRGKQRDIVSSPPPPTEFQKAPKAWWLDVSSPTWEDMRALGKLLHLHPLTLEDILQQDPREKLELFSRLGYYFIVFRAIESQTIRERFQRKGEYDRKPIGEGLVGEANVYLVVFREGICTFHFTDISAHTDRVRNRLLLLNNMSSDWIAHGILDSVVDSFFPFLAEIERDVIDMEDQVFSVDKARKTSANAQPQLGRTMDALPDQSDGKLDAKHRDDEKGDVMPFNDYNKDFTTVSGKVRARFSLPRLAVPMFFRRFKRMAHAAALSTIGAVKFPATNTAMTLRRMARTRRLVTSLTRLLATKSEVVTQIRKRLLITNTNMSGLGNGNGKADDVEVAIYMGDVQDHILTLQHSLDHYERMLSQSHPTYLAQLRASVAITKSGTDKAVMILSVISLSTLCIQILVGLFSLNVRVPTNRRRDGPGGPYYLFGVIIVVAIMIIITFVWTVRWWWVQVKQKRRSGPFCKSRATLR